MNGDRLDTFLALYERSLRGSRLFSIAITAFSIFVGVLLVALATYTTSRYVVAENKIAELQSQIDGLNGNSNKPVASPSSTPRTKKTTSVSPTVAPADNSNAVTQSTPCPEAPPGENRTDEVNRLNGEVERLQTALNTCRSKCQEKKPVNPAVIKRNTSVKVQ